ncbi:MAG: tRNA pseudouridine38-40 synthase [Sulfurimonas sp.]|jgi:tRNA pseudouridine38-40 synthase|uniref:tRNA pseudouridine(38-40) synthase TruA n=1 Tax=Sulfurimonas sp. TaxID=2022749 RepID=UPI0039E3FB27
MRCALNIAYNGTYYLGSQSQTQTPNTILGNLQKVCIQLGIYSKIIASGRTDKGVHATGQICHMDLPSFWNDLVKLKKVLNEMLPTSIRINTIIAVEDNFHARYGAKQRIYRYILKEGLSNAFENDFVTFVKELSFDELEKNIKLFRGEHNFKQFMKTGSDVKSTTRVIYKAFGYRHKGSIVLHFKANGFLRSQIRLMVGALLQLNTEQIKEQLACKNSYKIKPAPSNGLYLAKIKY